MELIDRRIQYRAANALKFLPFNIKFYSDVQFRGLDAEFIFENRDTYCQKRNNWLRNADSVEKSFRWLIKVGILRREVDGQGLTSRIRLTPLGRQILEKSPNLLKKRLNILEKMINCLSFRFQL